jgi:hypothetical protein
MPKPTNKAELLTLSQKNYMRLSDFVDACDAVDQHREFPPGTLNRNVRDVLGHLHHWHLMLLDWYTVGMRGEQPDMPAKGYTWKTTPALNRKIWELYRNVRLEEVRTLLDGSFQELQALIRAHTNEELFEKKRYKWTGTTSLGAYLVSATSSHYDWAFKLVKKALKS